uniref:Integrase catalytic domain-containing protein n=1 Tax=Meloidogyne floridensis TaxID=298350 RepID=A0A915P643_9BILA
MSSPLEQRLQITISKIVELLKVDPSEFDLDRVQEMPLEEEIIELESLIEDLDNLVKGLCSAKDEINSVFEDWTELNRKATATERPEFDASFKVFEAKNKPSFYFNEAEKRLTMLRMAKSKLGRKLRLKQLNLRRESAQIEQAPQIAPAAQVSHEVRHQALNIGKFYGTDPDLWSDWWELFASIHEDSKLSPERKFLYLRSFIPKESPAGLLIDGFHPGEYGQAIDLLRQNFENKDKRIRKLQQQLLTLPNCNTLEEVRKFYLNLERICRQLAGLGNDTDSDHYYNLLETKLTRPMLREILCAKKKAGDGWTTSKFRLELKKLLESEMEISSILKKTGDEKRQSPRKKEESHSPTIACSTVGKTNRFEESLVDKVRQFYQQDSLYLESDEQSAEEIDKAVHEQFKESLKFDKKEKRYEISLPFKNSELEKLPTNYALARGRLNSTLKKLRENPVLMEKYHQTMVQQHYEGIIEVAPRQADGPIHYLPHQYVWREDKQKLRVVFDASSHLGKSYCLNDVMHPGPLLLKDLAGILIRFRLPMIAISADIQAAFLQLKVAKEHRDVTRFLWPIDPYNLESPVKALRFVRLTFGLNCSPFILAATLLEHLAKSKSYVKKLIEENLYVDNVILSADNWEETLPICREAKRIFESGGFKLHEFASNHIAAMKKLPPDDKALWEDKDTEEKIPREKMWDKPIPVEKAKQWQKICKNWNGANLSIPRRVFSFERGKTKFELHAFADASNIGLGITIYLRGISESEAKTSLIFARSKVIPKQPKKRSIPRLELQAMFLTTKITKKIKEELALPLDKIQLWTDSENLLKWLGGNEKQKDCFINRRLEIISDWNVNYVPTKENPADIASRGIKAEELINSELWLNGPPWLNTKLEEENWPSSSPYNYIAGEKKEKEQIFHSIQAANIKQEKGEEPIELFRAIGISTTEALLKNGVRYKSAWRKMKGTAAFVARFLVKILSKEAKHPFINEWREIVKEGPLTAEELSLGEKIIIRSTQRNLSENGLDTIPGKLFEDEDRILRSGGRMEHSEMSETAKWPIFVPKHSKMAELILEDSHLETFHGGTNTMTAWVRQKFWIPQIRQVANRIKRKCNKCKIFKVKQFKVPAPPPLPSSRVVKTSPWANIGVDYTGPFTVYENGEEKKRYICLFNCLTTRAVHMEVATDASAAAFLKAFRRFCALCRIPKLIISDNGTNFTASAKVLGDIWKRIALDDSIQRMQQQRKSPGILLLKGHPGEMDLQKFSINP